MIADASWLLLYAFAIFLIGHVLVSIILAHDRRSWVEYMGLVPSVGAGALGLILFWASLLGFKPSRGLLAGVILVFGLKEFLLWRNRRPSSSPSILGERPRGLELLALVAPIAVVAVAVVLVSLHAIALPILEWDAIAIWAFKAKVLAHASLWSRPQYFYDTTLSYSHLDYPLLVPFLMAGAYGAMGEVNEYLGKIIFPILYIAFGFQIFSALNWKLNWIWCLQLSALAMTVPGLLSRTGAGTADFVLTLFYLGAVFYLIKWIAEQKKSDLILSILFTAFMAFTKNEGLALAVIIGAVMSLFCALRPTKTNLLALSAFLVALLLFNLPWLWWSRSIPRTHENYAARLTFSMIAANLDRLGVISAEFLKQTCDWSRWGLTWPLLFAAVLWGRRGFSHGYVRLLWLLLFAQMALYVLIFVVTPWDIHQLFASTLDRLFLQTMPAVFLLIAQHWREGALPNDSPVRNVC